MNTPAVTTFQTPGTTQHIMGAIIELGMAQILANHHNGLEATMKWWSETHRSPENQVTGAFSTSTTATEVVGHNLPSHHPMNLRSGCGSDCTCGGNCGGKEKAACDCQHEVDYKVPGMG